MHMCSARAMIRLGKHRGRRYEEIAATDRSYCAWVMREKGLPQGFNNFRKYLISVHGGIMSVGKHKGSYFDEVLTEARDYCEWAIGLQAPSECFQPFVAYCRAHLKDEEPTAKKQRADDKVCAICCDRPRDSVFVPCGHIASCLPCGLQFAELECPICKQYVSMVVKTYTV